MGEPAVTIDLTDEHRAELEGLVRRRQTAQGLARRAEIVLLAADGLQNKEIVARLGKDANTVGKWRRRFAEHGVDGLYDEPRPGTPRKIGDDEIAETVRKTLEETPVDATHWSLCSMAKATAMRPRPSIGSGRRSACSPIAAKPSSFPPIHFLLRRCAISSGFISPFRSVPWCCAWMRKAKSKRLIGPSRYYR